MAAFLERYQAGDCVAVWNDLAALGDSVRGNKYYADAVAVAAEAMRRARYNVELLIQRLAQAGYRFVAPSDEEDPGERRQTANPGGRDRAQRERWKVARRSALETRVAAGLTKPPLENPAVFAPPSGQAAAQLNSLEEAIGGPVPLALRAWYEQVGAVSLIGSHEVLNPKGRETADPLVVWPLDTKFSHSGF